MRGALAISMTKHADSLQLVQHQQTGGSQMMIKRVAASAIALLALFFTVANCQQQSDLPVSQACLGCICEAISGCNTTAVCSGDVCGPFRITWAYWADSGKPTVNQESPESQTAYKNCVTDTYCAALAVQGYMQKYQQDCNGDNKLDCDDFAAIHKLGGYGCRGVPLPDDYNSRYVQCKTIVGNLKP